MDVFLAFVTSHLEDLMRRMLGPAATDRVFGAVTRNDVASTVVFLLLAAALGALAGWVLRRQARARAGAPVSLPLHMLSAGRRPLVILILVYGVYAAATPLLLEVQPADGLATLRGGLDLVFNLGALLALFWFLFRATHAIEAKLLVWAARTTSKVDDLLVPLLGTSLRAVVVVIGVIIALPTLPLPAAYSDVIGKLSSMAFIAVVAVLLFRSVRIFRLVVLTRFDITAADNLQARKVYTQIHVISRVLDVVIGIVAVAAALMLFQQVRHIGTSLLASAGVLGIIAGFAAQKTLANLFAGFQIALAQPVRQDDVVVVEGEWGRVEEITLTYVVVHIWDDRRLVLPLSYFIEKPFQNWTRTSADLLGSVFVWVDYSFPVEEGRRALKDIVEGSPLWDGRFWNLQVTDADERCMQLRVLATSADSSKSFDLRCEIRERFIAYLQSHHPQARPRLRAEMS